MDKLVHNKIFDGIYRPGEDGIPEFKAYVAGQWVFGESFSEVKSPIDGRIIARVSRLSRDQVEEALARVYEKGREEIRNYPGEKRVQSFLKAAGLMREAFEDFVNVLILDAGKPKSNAVGETKATIERLEKTTFESRRMLGDYVPGDWSEETLESEGIVKREPYGLILAISPFNYPLFISAAKVVPALLSGNTVLLKPASADPLAAIMFVRVLELAGFPKESFALLTIPGSFMDDVVKDRRIRAITFTGSTEVGEHIIRTGGIKAYHLELGGKDPAIVLDDANLELASEKIVKGMVSFSGQRCDAIRLILAQEKIYEDLKARILEKLKGMEPRNPLEDENAVMGPLIDESSAEYIEEVYKDAVEKGARPLTEFRRKGNYVWPILLEVSKEKIKDLRAFNEDVFGSMALLIKVKDEDEAIEIAKSSRFGLDASVFSECERRARKVARKLEVGSVFINEYPRHGIGYYPFGGMKDSGVGREGIGYSVEQFTTTKTIVHNFKGYGVWEYL
ncbi:MULTISPECIES: NADP-dependent glyceraldehyde-3-phosphate dehydrogenase [Thermococcus]|uniref:Non-phosphorylating glyceraldehyde-3-phosphate dehydrogenase (GAPN) n=2 Tax=Thermococcus sibiricus TaxID=172049 RepID=C5ZZT6_THESM|nr:MULTISPECIES: NADP-dependent glyceraldehyde-3-phosphate dehydrogenase [Thermococcus]KUK29136.1 MAG: Non-phosphorylating glyceraldehyde-3-phosphate dehydrogenase (GAPN) [Thermococcus sp. 40_45]HII66955.1 aldehyde dehydrogenase family protein [Thermococcaceae archaeon]ACS90917.1 non-phosphorylating glyceraldehyde-3-phosphate dehydrogenase (GAPN) [Thermococcus sibiricus MM 739]KUK18495.1 MAG: Non-phosphorylating glyceraldehyde-3-phosphate dehydrogenase (GAPN) [Thermococcus sibiricus]MBC7094065